LVVEEVVVLVLGMLFAVVLYLAEWVVLLVRDLYSDQELALELGVLM
jgi:hypothetical protein